jgi:hypothetical protein
MDPQVREEMRGSLVLSVLAQLSSDRDPETRASAVQSLATLSRAITDADKFPQMLRLALEFVSRDGCIVAPPLVNFLFCFLFFVYPKSHTATMFFLSPPTTQPCFCRGRQRCSGLPPGIQGSTWRDLYWRDENADDPRAVAGGQECVFGF